MTSSPSQSRATLRRHGRSFHWAGRFLPEHQLHAGARLYHVCRQVDDIADNAANDAQRDRAARLLAALQQRLAARRPASSTSPLIIDVQAPGRVADAGAANAALSSDEQRLVADIQADIDALFAENSLAVHAMQDLLATMQTDLSPLHLTSEQALLRYAYGAAGTVGVMMCPLLNVRDQACALPHAIDLGMGMQMTNIARDVLEDARRGRVYLPRSWLTGDVTAEAIAEGDAHARRQAWLAARRLVARADAYYASGWQGLAYLPWRARLAIGVALRVYRAIGKRLERLDERAYWAGRVVVPAVSKGYQSIRAMPALFAFGRRGQHDASLHTPLGCCLSPYGLGPAGDAP